jgi:hypothetical protein
MRRQIKGCHPSIIANDSQLLGRIRELCPEWHRYVTVVQQAPGRVTRSGPMGEVIEDHIREHVVEPTKSSERFEGGEELIEAIQSYLK